MDRLAIAAQDEGLIQAPLQQNERQDVAGRPQPAAFAEEVPAPREDSLLLELEGGRIRVQLGRNGPCPPDLGIDEGLGMVHG
ncbi:MAG: hypothetical protein ACE5HP_09025 [Gemmatimonadota bacterium]